ncbi:MAG: nicotinamide-nucleotide amidohydrolase family protein [Gammaproteobacteria bacterium]|jgi:nicotinamide-nucleotide amidase
MDEERLRQLADRLSEYCIAQHHMLMTAESCTGGWVAKVCTDLPGSSRWFEQGFVTYSNKAKQSMLGVSAQTLSQHGAVSGAVVREMVAGALEHGNGDLAVAISGIAGPGGGTHFKPRGTVWIAWQQEDGEATAQRFHFEGDRTAVRFQAVEAALKGLIELVQD